VLDSTKKSVPENASQHSLAASNPISYWRQQYQQNLLALKEDFSKKANTFQLFKQHTKVIDHMLISLWDYANVSEDCCLIAVGGYGRGEMYPYSDIDLLILTPESHSADIDPHNTIEQMIGLFWDIGLNIGHSVRSLNECMTEANNDITIQTNLIECRLISGNRKLYHQYLEAIVDAMDVPRFFDGKIKEQDNRYAKFNDTAYNLEPNIKESPGGLRDIQSVMWLTRSLIMSKHCHVGSRFTISETFKASNHQLWAWLIAQKIVSDSEVRQMRLHEKKLQKLRTHLHFLSNRREDRLLFDFQNELASTLGYTTNPRKRASEQLMQSYYRSVKYIQVMNEILIKSLSQLLITTPPMIKPINARFESRNQLLEAKYRHLLQQDPTAIFEAFLILQQHPEVKGMGATLLRNLQRVKHLVNTDFRHDPINKARFIEILSQENGVNQTLRAMNRYGILGCYIPIFGKIIGQMQHDLFHVYTVDEHILNVLANLRRFAKPELRHEFPLCTKLFAAFEKPHLLYLGALFHDIAKGRNGDHSTLGMHDALKFCRLHNLPKEDAELVAWLVDAHLKMSATAQKSDLSDPSVIKSFAHFVKNEHRLIALYLLTVADIRGTSPIVWNAWKARLLENLFYSTRNALANQIEYAQNAIATRHQQASAKLKLYGLKPESYESLWEKFGENYLVRHETDEIIWQSRLLTAHLNTNKPIVRARLSPNGDGIQTMIYHKIQDDLFARICHFFDRMNYSIAAAKIYTTEHGYGLDTFIILDNSGKAVSYNGLLKFIETDLTLKLDQNQSLENPMQGRVSRQVKHIPYQTQVTLTEVADNHHSLEISASDKPGLLAKLAHLFLVHEIDLHNAKINTMGNRAEDFFLISARKNQKLTTENLKSLREAILESI